MAVSSRSFSGISQFAIQLGNALFLWAIYLTIGLGFSQDGRLDAQDLGLTIQLPTQTFFGVNTVVSVPDGGTMSLGGNSGSAWGSTQRSVPGLANLTGPGRLFNNHALGGGQFASNMSVHVRVISLSEMESELLAQLPAGKTLADYARPKPISVSIRESSLASKLPGLSNEFDSPGQSQSQEVSNVRQPVDETEAESISRSQAARTKSDRVKLLSKPVSRERVVNPNGSIEIQNKADFMSRNIGRRKK